MVFHPKSQPAPTCLADEKAKKNGSYRCGDVLQRLQEDFKNKCYICEQKEPSAINIEHFIAHRGDNDRKFDWNNLFYCCAHCNNTKLAKSEYDAILSCIVETDGVDTKIRYHINPFPKEKVAINAINNEIEVQHTVNLLLAIYNGSDTQNKQMEAANLRNLLLKDIRTFQAELFCFYDDTYTADEKNSSKIKIMRSLRSSSAFTAFKKWIVRDNEVLLKDFGEYL